MPDMPMLLVDGPCRGEVVVTRGAPVVQTFLHDGAGIHDNPVMYQVRKWMIMGHVILLGVSGDDPSQESLFDLVISDAAKRCEQPRE